MSTTGEKLKQQLGLNKFKIIRLHRCIDCSHPTYFIYVDSRRPTMPITNARVLKNPGVANIYNGNKLPKESIYTPLMNIEEFNATLKGRIFILIDLAGMNLINSKMYEKEDNNSYNCDFYFYGSIQELYEYTISEFKKDGVSDLTKKWFKKRQKDEGASQGVTIENIEWSEKENELLVQFFVIPTYKQNIQTVDFKGNVKTDNHYETEVLFTNVSEYLGTKQEFLELSKKDQISKINKMIKNSDIKLHSNDLSWFFQGHFEWADVADYAIYEFKGPAGKGDWRAKHNDKDITITKHIFETLQAISFLSDEIAKNIREE